MTLDEAIKHCEEVADVCEFEASKYDVTDPYESSCAGREGECANEHRQLAEWLRKYQKIEQTLDDYDLEAWEILEMIKEVVKV